MQDLTLLEKLAVWFLPVLFAITVHETAHGWAAEKLGDKTARRLGRISLNPVKHIDPVGTLLVPGLLLAFGGFLFGWAKPVPVTYENLRRARRDAALVAAAGPGANLLMALLWTAVAWAGLRIPGLEPGIRQGLAWMGVAGLQINVVLMVLNLLPIPPLDGSKVVGSLLPPRLEYQYTRIEPFGFVILLVLLVTGLLSRLMGGPVSAIMQAIGALFGIR